MLCSARRTGLASLLVLLALHASGCGSSAPRIEHHERDAGAESPAEPVKTDEPNDIAELAESDDPGVREAREREDVIFDRELAAMGSLDGETLAARLGPRAPERVALGFDPTSARYWPEVSAALGMTAPETAKLRENGFVALSRKDPRSMARVYEEIYNRDLPVLITTDSILEALHRSFDEALMALEAESLARTMSDILRATHERLALEAKRAPALKESMRDVDLYLTVARNLLAGFGSPDTIPAWMDQPVAVASALGMDIEARALLRSMASYAVRNEVVYGRERMVDFSQFKPRGHYDRNIELGRYFRAMMWLGRADLGFDLEIGREAADAALLTMLLQASGQMDRLKSVSSLIDFLVGRGDSQSPIEMLPLLGEAGINAPERIADAAATAQLTAKAAAKRQLVHSEVTQSPTQTRAIFQVFGQRFVLDSFILDRVVYDRIVHEGRKVERTMPTGLDVMAALGNREAFALLEPELSKHHYAPNLLAARAVADSYTPAAWSETAYNVWLSALRALDDAPEAGSFPIAMKSRAWQQKQLQAQLGSWAELRHDTILYTSQSSAGVLCEYPAGYVEPYPQFFARVGFLASKLSRRIGTFKSPNPTPEEMMADVRSRIGFFFANFAKTMKTLEQLARKELSSTPFTAEERAFLKDTIVVQSMGCTSGYTGWYAQLHYAGSSEDFKPVVADVHTDPNSGVLEVGVGNTDFVVVAVDNQKDRAVYVGPTFSYYEFTSGHRMTDPDWQRALDSGTAPGRPAWVRSFAGLPAQALPPLKPHGPAKPPARRAEW